MKNTFKTIIAGIIGAVLIFAVKQSNNAQAQGFFASDTGAIYKTSVQAPAPINLSIALTQNCFDVKFDPLNLTYTARFDKMSTAPFAYTQPAGKWKQRQISGDMRIQINDNNTLTIIIYNIRVFERNAATLGYSNIYFLDQLALKRGAQLNEQFRTSDAPILIRTLNDFISQLL